MQVKRIEIIQKTNEDSLVDFLKRINKRIKEINLIYDETKLEVIDIKQIVTDNLNYRECMLIIGYK